MNFTHIARNMRPKKFSDIVGQKKWTSFIQSALTEGVMLPVCIIYGPSGVGKTTLARLIAMWQCCNQKTGPEPCGTCESCQAIVNDCHPDVIEFDAATYTGVEDLKTVLSNIDYKTLLSQKRVYILDEVHMLSRSAVSSLLKIFESKLDGVQFILATTNPEKLPDTIMSRGFRIQLDSISIAETAEYLQKICKENSLTVAPQAAELIAKSSKGSLRQALSTLEQCAIAQGSNIMMTGTEEILGFTDDELLEKILSCLDSLNIKEALQLVSRVPNQAIFMQQILERIRQKITSQQASDRLIQIGYSLAEASVIMHRSPCNNLLEILLGKAIVDAMGSTPDAPSPSLSNMAREIFKR